MFIEKNMNPIMLLFTQVTPDLKYETVTIVLN